MDPHVQFAERLIRATIWTPRAAPHCAAWVADVWLDCGAPVDLAAGWRGRGWRRAARRLPELVAFEAERLGANSVDMPLVLDIGVAARALLLWDGRAWVGWLADGVGRADRRPTQIWRLPWKCSAPRSRLANR